LGALLVVKKVGSRVKLAADTHQNGRKMKRGVDERQDDVNERT
jgi:hypothetical protein